MPRVYLKREERRAVKLRALLAAQKTENNLSDEDLAKGLGIGRSTYYNHLKDPGKMTLSELWALQGRMKIPADDLANCLFRD